MTTDLDEITIAARCHAQFVGLYRLLLGAEGESLAYRRRIARQIEDAYQDWRRQLGTYPENMAYELKLSALEAVREARRNPEPETGQFVNGVQV